MRTSTLPDLHSPKEVQAQFEVKLPGVEGQGADEEQQRQDGLIAPDVEGPPTVEENQRTSQHRTGPHRRRHMRVERTPHSVGNKNLLQH